MISVRALKRRLLVEASICATLLASGCIPPTTGTMMPEGYRHGGHDYAISALAGGSRLLPEGWQLESARVDKGWLKPRRDPEHEARLYFDVDDDGRTDTAEPMPFFDLRYRHEPGHATLWVSTLPMPRTLKDSPLDAVVQHYLAAARKTGFQSVDLGLGGPEAVQPTESTTVLSARGTLGGSEARAIKLAVQSAPGSDGRAGGPSQVVIAVSRPNFFHVVKAPGQKDVKFPVLLVVGYQSDEASYDALLPDFESLLSRLSLPNGKIGARLTWIDRSGAVVADASNTPGPADRAQAREEAEAFLASEKLELKVTGKGALDFDRDAALAALGEATTAARSCRVDPGTGSVSGPRGAGAIRIVFAPSGYVQSATLEGDGKRFDGTTVGQCVVGTFRMTAVPPFERDPVSVLKRFAVD